jgi:hypothetical protein
MTTEHREPVVRSDRTHGMTFADCLNIPVARRSRGELFGAVFRTGKWHDVQLFFGVRKSDDWKWP